MLDFTITPLFFVDDLKVYVKSWQDWEEGMHLVNSVSRAVGMDLGLMKCTVVHVHDKRVRLNRPQMPKNCVIGALERGTEYHYLGVNQSLKTNVYKVKEVLEATYASQV